jgi:hypothetical protein
MYRCFQTLLWAMVLFWSLEQANAKVYTVYGVAGMSQESFLSQWRPIFQEYLTTEVRKMLVNESVSFRLLSTQQDKLQGKVEAGEADFLFVGKYQMIRGLHTAHQQ